MPDQHASVRRNFLDDTQAAIISLPTTIAFPAGEAPMGRVVKTTLLDRNFELLILPGEMSTDKIAVNPLQGHANDSEIISSCGGSNRAVLTHCQFLAIFELQKNGEPGPLKTDGKTWHISYLDIDGIPCAASSIWRDDKWSHEFDKWVLTRPIYRWPPARILYPAPWAY